MPKATKKDWAKVWSVSPEGIASLKAEANKQAWPHAELLKGESLEKFAARIWAAGFCYAREYFMESVALKNAGWPEDKRHNESKPSHGGGEP